MPTWQQLAAMVPPQRQNYILQFTTHGAHHSEAQCQGLFALLHLTHLMRVHSVADPHQNSRGPFRVWHHAFHSRNYDDKPKSLE